MLYLALLLLLPATVHSQVATPARSVGLVYSGNPDAKVHVEVFLDLICPDSREAWPKIKEMADYFGPDNVRLVVQLFPLPYHQNAFYASRAAFVIHQLTNGSRTFDWIDNILLNHLDELRDANFHEKSDADLLKLFAGYAREIGVTSSAFVELLDRRNSNEFEQITRLMWKYSCTRGVAGTPTYMVNGIIHPNVRQTWGSNEWRSFMENLLEFQLFDDINNVTRQPVRGVSNWEGNTGTTTLTSSFFILISAVIPLTHIWR